MTPDTFTSTGRQDGMIATVQSIPVPLALPDIWVTKSVLQKSIRRGDADLAARAAMTLLMMDPAALWQRMLVIGFEDVGLGDMEAVGTATMATSARWRKAMGGDIPAAIAVARRLAEAPTTRKVELSYGRSLQVLDDGGLLDAAGHPRDRLIPADA